MTTETLNQLPEAVQNVVDRHVEKLRVLDVVNAYATPQGEAAAKLVDALHKLAENFNFLRGQVAAAAINDLSMEALAEAYDLPQLFTPIEDFNDLNNLARFLGVQQNKALAAEESNQAVFFYDFASQTAYTYDSEPVRAIMALAAVGEDTLRRYKAVAVTALTEGGKEVTADALVEELGKMEALGLNSLTALGLKQSILTMIANL